MADEEHKEWQARQDALHKQRRPSPTHRKKPESGGSHRSESLADRQRKNWRADEADPT